MARTFSGPVTWVRFQLSLMVRLTLGSTDPVPAVPNGKMVDTPATLTVSDTSETPVSIVLRQGQHIGIAGDHRQVLHNLAILNIDPRIRLADRVPP